MAKFDEAVAYAEKGFAIFPVWGVSPNNKCLCGGLASCGKGDNAGKHPITPRGVLEATTNINQVRAWWQAYPEANIGIATGEKSGIVVLDVDGPKGFASLNRDSRNLPKTPSVTTGRVDGGVHFYFKHPGGKVKNSIKKLGEGLDIRGDGGYVIAPPSRHISGNHYEWAEPLDTGCAELPEWVRSAVEDASIGLDTSQDGEIIEKGGRNVYLTSLAGSMRKRGMPESAIYAALSATNNERCSPPLPDEEIRKIALSIGGKPFDTSDEPRLDIAIIDPVLGEIVPSEACKEAAHSDVGNAEAFVSLFRDKFRYDHQRKRWLVWPENGSAWLDDTNEAHRRAMVATLRARQHIATTITDDAERDALQKWARKCESGVHIQTALRLAQSMNPLAVQAEQFDSQPFYLNFFNGTLELETLTFRDAKQADYLTRLCPLEYVPSAKAPLWEQFIEQVFGENQELIAYVQRALGYCLTGSMKEQAIFIAHGAGANGKSTLLNTVGRALGNYSAVTAFKTFDADNRNEYGNDLAILKGVRFVPAIESESGKRLAEARVKSITGQDRISCRFLYGEFFQLEPQFKVWLAVNHKPVIRGTDHGIWRRIHLIPFNQTFGDKAGELPVDRNLDLKLARELPGVMNWLIEGFLEWQKHGLKPPESVVQATKEYRVESDYIAQWLEFRTLPKEDGRMSAIEGYQDFRQYLTDIGEATDRNIPSLKVWGLGMADKGFSKERGAKGYTYHGLELLPLKLTERGN